MFAVYESVLENHVNGNKNIFIKRDKPYLIIRPGLHVKLDCTYGGLYSRTSFIYKYKTSTLTPFVKPCDKLKTIYQYLKNDQNPTYFVIIVCNSAKSDGNMLK